MRLLHTWLISLLTTPVAAQGPRLVRDIVAGARGSMPSTGASLVPLGRLIVFPADDGVAGIEPWRSDGTAAGTYRLADIEPGPGSSAPTELVALGGLVFFNAYSTVSGHELWVTDGTPAGTRMVVDLAPGARNSNAGRFVPFRDMLLFFADDGTGARVFRTDGTAAGTRAVAALPTPASGLRTLSVAGNLLYCFVYGGTNASHELQAWNGTGAPVLVAQTQSDPLPPEPVGDLGGRFVFMVHSAGWTHLWSTDGTATGTAVISPLLQRPTAFAFAGDRMFYIEPGFGQPSLRVSDGTLAGDRAVRQFQRSASGTTAVGDRVFLFADDGMYVSAWSIWVSDGTAAGTRSIGMDSVGMAAVGTRNLAFVARQAAAGRELWLTDGNGLGIVADLNPGPADAFPPTAAVVIALGGGRLWFWADDGTTGMELRVAHLGASAHPAGLGCAPGRWPELRGTDPVLGATMAMTGRSPLATTPAALLLGAPALVPARVAPGCVLQLDLTGPLLAWTFVTDGAGSWSLPPWNVPNVPALDGLTLAAQAALLQQGGALGLAISNGIELTAGR